MTRLRRTLAACLLVSIASAALATAQENTGKVGNVVEIAGPVGSVIVARGAQSYALQDGDALFDGDRIFTRSNGGIRLTANGCERTLEASASVVISKDICDAAPILVTTEAALVLDVASAGTTAATAVEVGASPNLLSVLAGGGGAAAAAAAAAGGATPAAIID